MICTLLLTGAASAKDRRTPFAAHWNSLMTDLSPTAQAVLNAAYRRMEDNPFNEVEATLAAALRAAADQVVPTTVDPRLSTVRSDLMRIAAELESR
jgi:hypothetical protein